jgi:hypothetical protein
LSFLVPFLLLVSFAGWGLLSELILHVTDNGWDTEMMVRTRRKIAEEENCVLRTRWLRRSCGGKMAPTTTKPRIEWVRGRVRIIARVHHAIDKVEKPSLDGIRDNHDPDRPHQSCTNHHLISFFLLSFVS